MVLIVTDFGCSVYFYFRLSRALNRLGFTVQTVSTGSFGSLSTQARRLSRVLEDQNIDKCILIAHGKGALAALALPDSGRRRVMHLVSLGTPFHGSRLFLPFLMVPVFRDMAVGSDFLLLHRMNALLFPSFSPFCAYRDQFIVPPTLAHFGQGRDLILDLAGRWNLVLDGDNVSTIVSHIQSAHPEPVIEKPVAPETATLTEGSKKPGVKSKPAAKKKGSAKKPALKSKGKSRR